MASGHWHPGRGAPERHLLQAVRGAGRQPGRAGCGALATRWSSRETPIGGELAPASDAESEAADAGTRVRFMRKEPCSSARASWRGQGRERSPERAWVSADAHSSGLAAAAKTQASVSCQ